VPEFTEERGDLLAAPDVVMGKELRIGLAELKGPAEIQQERAPVRPGLVGSVDVVEHG
jgi:hypothetical protein